MPPLRFRIRTVMIFTVVLALALGVYRFAFGLEITRVSLEVGGPRILVIHLWSPAYFDQRGISQAVSIPLSPVEIVLVIGLFVACSRIFARLFRVEHQRRKPQVDCPGPNTMPSHRLDSPE